MTSCFISENSPRWTSEADPEIKIRVVIWEVVSGYQKVIKDARKGQARQPVKDVLPMQLPVWATGS